MDKDVICDYGNLYKAYKKLKVVKNIIQALQNLKQ